jgi:hypothetical protein
MTATATPIPDVASPTPTPTSVDSPAKPGAPRSRQGEKARSRARKEAESVASDPNRIALVAVRLARSDDDLVRQLSQLVGIEVGSDLNTEPRIAALAVTAGSPGTWRDPLGSLLALRGQEPLNVGLAVARWSAVTVSGAVEVLGAAGASLHVGRDKDKAVDEVARRILSLDDEVWDRLKMFATLTGVTP